jgi:hypothetical protein
MDRIAEFIDKSIGPGGQWIDCFATADTAQFPRWWPQAEAEDWSAAGREGCRLWANPPYSRWNDYAKLVVEAKAEVVCLLPDWGQECLPTLLDRSLLKGYIPAGAAIFEMSNGVRCPPTKWEMWLLVLGRVRQLQPPTRRYEGIRILPLNRPGELLAASRTR